MTVSLEMVSDKDGVTESGKAVPAGTRCDYECHVPGGMVRVTLPDGSSEVVHPHIFAALRPAPKRAGKKVKP